MLKSASSVELNFKEGDKKVRDHCHFTGAYRGCAHDDCNLGFSMRYCKIPVFLHNLKNYDAHLIINKAHELNKNSEIDCIAQNSEKFITFGLKIFVSRTVSVSYHLLWISWSS